jgi:GTP-binding protein HflX
MMRQILPARRVLDPVSRTFLLFVRQHRPPKRAIHRREEEDPIHDTREALRRERAILVAQGGAFPAARAAASLEELDRLADTAGAEVVDRMLQRRGRLHPATYLTKGKVQELKERCGELRADVVVFDDELSPAQVRTLEKTLGVRVLDRSELILAIFARRARTREARLQVELAQLEYSLPRLRRMWQHLSRTGGGIGTRGPGETQLEVDRRRARERIARLKEGLEQVDRERETQRKARRRAFRVALVGYTNAGKSTLFNVLTRAAVHTEDRLFATLDSTTRRLAGAAGPPARERDVLVTDTVGFIRKLPHHLVASFRSTLSEVVEADLLVIVADASDSESESQLAEVHRVLDALVVEGKPRWLTFNKVDALADPDDAMALRASHPDSLLISARTGEGVGALRERIVAEADARASEAA